MALNGRQVQCPSEARCNISVFDTNNQNPEITYPLDTVRIELDPPYPAPLEDIDGKAIVIAARDGDKQEEFKTIAFDMTSTGQVLDFFQLFSNGTLYLKKNLTNFVFDNANDNTINVRLN